MSNVICLPNPIREPTQRGEKTLAWCRKHIPGFKDHKAAADRAIRHTAKIKAKHGHP